MAIVVKPKAAQITLVKNGTYRAHLTAVRQFTNTYGERIGFEFTIHGGPHHGATVMRSTAPQLTARSKLADVLVGLLGRDLTEEELSQGVDLEELIGLECQILVLQQRNNRTGAVYSNVEQVFSVS